MATSRRRVWGRTVPAGLLIAGALVWAPGALGVDGGSREATPRLIEKARAAGAIDEETEALYLAYALRAPERLPEAYRSKAPWRGTLPLRSLREKVATMKEGPARATIQKLLAGTCSDASGVLPSVLDTTNFHIQYGTIGGGLTASDYGTSLETTWTTEVTSFGWAAPPVLGLNPPPENRYHVRVESLGSGLYGYVDVSGDHAGFVGDNPNTAWNDLDAYASCMVLNDDYTGFPGTPQVALDATTAHEFNHSIQFGYGALTGTGRAEDVFVEGGASWMEDEVFDAADDNYGYLWPNFTMCLGQYTASPYNYWIVFRAMTERYGANTPGGSEQVMQDFWEETSKRTTQNLAALGVALGNRGTNVADAFHAAAIAAKLDRPCGGGYVYPYCFEEAAGYAAAAGSVPWTRTIASVGSSATASTPDNYAAAFVRLPTTGGSFSVTLSNTDASGGELRASVVCDTGSALTITPFPAVVGPSGSSTLNPVDPAGCTTLGLVLTNQSQTGANPGSCTARAWTVSTGTVPVELQLFTAD